MRKEYNRASKAEFEKQVKELSPQFRRAKSNSDLGPSLGLYRLQAADDLYFFIELVPHRLQERFTVEIGWSTDGVLPKAEAFASPRDPPKGNGHVVRLPSFYTDKDPWWEVEPLPPGKELLRRVREGIYPDPEDYLPRVPDVVADAVGKIREFAIPYLTRVAAERGVCIKLGT
ncbi:MAG: hypothetical protein ACLQVD_20905 [Capsulimonadaceae bacterium]